jgi:hypothetical protein
MTPNSQKLKILLIKNNIKEEEEGEAQDIFYLTKSCHH